MASNAGQGDSRLHTTKRASESDCYSPSKSKKLRSASPEAVATAFEPSLRRHIADIFQHGIDESGYVCVKIFMKWPPINGSMRFQVKPMDGVSSEKFNVVFPGQWSKHKGFIAPAFHDEIQLALKGAVVENTDSSCPTLKYERGVLFKFVKRRDSNQSGQIVNIWTPGHHDQDIPNQPIQDDWFATPADIPVPKDHQKDVNMDVDVPSVPNTSVTSCSSVSSPSLPSNPEPPITSPLSAQVQSHTVSDCKDLRLEASAIDSGTRGLSDQGREDQEISTEGSVHDKPSSSTRVSPPRVPDGNASAMKQQENPRPNKPNATAPQKNVKKDGRVNSTGAGPSEDRGNQEKLTSAKIRKLEKKRARKMKQGLKASAERAPDGNRNSPESPTLSSRRGVGQNFGATAPTDTSVRPSASRCIIVDASTDIAIQTASTSNTSPDNQPVSPPSVLAAQEHVRRSTSERAASSPSDPQATSSSSHPVVQDHNVDLPSLLHTSVSVPLPSRSALLESSSTSQLALDAGHAMKSESPGPAGSLLDGFYTDHGYYTPLVKVQDKKAYNIMGVVTSIGEKSTTATGEHKSRFFLRDPSMGDSGDFSVICFARVESSLPEPRMDDILLLRQIQGDTWQGRCCGVAPSYKAWTWAKFDPRTSEDAQAQSQISENTLRLQPSPTEQRYCHRIAEWWKSTNPNAFVDLGEVHQISSRYSVGGRVHRLIADASPTSEPHGYFDCTIEVLAGYANGNGVYTLFVTDYTSNNSMIPVERDLWPKQLADKVLKLELFLDAAEKGPAIAEQKGYYFFGNCRMKVSAGGFWEATFSQLNKMRALDEDELENEPHLAELLKRKEKFNATMTAHGGADEFPHKRFDEVEEDRIFCCTVEVLSISPKEERTYLYVTDYTSRTDLVPVNTASTNFEGLENRVVKIALFNGQATTANNLEPGDIILIRNLRLKASGGIKKLAGRLGGDQRLINKLQTKGTNNVEVKALLRRKEEWEALKAKRGKNAQSNRSRRSGKTADVQSVSPNSETRPAEASEAAPSVPAPVHDAVPATPRATKSTKWKSIKQLEASEKCPNKFLVRARIVDFFPESVADFTIRRCTNCGTQTPDKFRFCPPCDDVMDPDDRTFVRAFWQFWFMIEDEEGSRLELKVCDDQCALLKDFDPANVNEDPDALADFTKRLEPLIGPLMEFREGIACRRVEQFGQEEPETPSLDLTIGSWYAGEKRDARSRRYLLLHHEDAV